VLIVENRDTTVQNSPAFPLGEAQKKRLIDLTHSLWAKGGE